MTQYGSEMTHEQCTIITHEKGKDMTPEEYRAEELEVLSSVPAEFQKILSYMAYDAGHSGGYEECLNYLRDYVYDLGQPISEFGERRYKEGLIEGKIYGGHHAD